jgi:hypothetical protein
VQGEKWETMALSGFATLVLCSDILDFQGIFSFFNVLALWMGIF